MSEVGRMKERRPDVGFQKLSRCTEKDIETLKSNEGKWFLRHVTIVSSLPPSFPTNDNILLCKELQKHLLSRGWPRKKSQKWAGGLSPPPVKSCRQRHEKHENVGYALQILGTFFSLPLHSGEFPLHCDQGSVSP